MIPHFNNKSRSIPSDMKRIEELNRLIFDAYEDANNYIKLGESLKIYKNEGVDNFPFIAFSDCHNIEHYPKTNEKDEKISISKILGDINYPYNSLKTAFEEPSLRITIDNVDSMRSSKSNIEEFTILSDGKPILLSPYLNTIIGSFGSGKSYLIDLLFNGLNGVDKIYKDLADDESDFKVIFNGVKASSLSELKSLSHITNIIRLKQYEELTFKNTIDKDYMTKLSNQLNFEIPYLESYKINYDFELLGESISKMIEDKTRTDNLNEFNYKNAFKEVETYTIINNKEFKYNYQPIKNILENNETSDNLKEIKIDGLNLFTDEDIITISSFDDLISDKLNVVNKLLFLDDFFKDLTEAVEAFNERNDFKNHRDVKDTVEKTINKYLENIIELNDKTSLFEETFNQNKYDELFNKTKAIDLENYTIFTKYKNIENDSYLPIVNHLFSRDNRKENLFNTLITAIDNNTKLLQNKEFSEYPAYFTSYKYKVEKQFNNNNVEYDIYTKDLDKSILKLSPGERSREIIRLLFDMIKKAIKEEERTIVIIDQPENNLDNKNIVEDIVYNIKETKMIDKSNYITFILVTHNANISITADSENIIISNNNNGEFYYETGSIENSEHIDEVCEILEGGTEALMARSSKYNIGIKRKVEKK